MTDEHAELDAALERVFEAARAHLVAVKAADGRADDDDVWQAYVTLNNASFQYDELMLDAYNEVTPWDVESIDPDEAEVQFGAAAAALEGGSDDPHPRVVSVRQRRDYRIPSVAGLLRIADSARKSSLEEDSADVPVESVGEAVLELLQNGDGSLASLDVPELEPLDGIVTVTEVDMPLDLEAYDEEDGAGPFIVDSGDRLVGRLDEHPYVALDDEVDEDEIDSDERR